MTRLPRFVLPALSLFTLAVAGACAGGTENGGDDDGPDAAIAVDAPATDASPEVDAPMVDAPTADAPSDASPDAMTDAMTDAMPLAGDACAMAEVITISGGLGTATLTGTTAGYANDYMPDACASGYLQDGPDHVYEVSVPAGALLGATVTPASGYDPGIYLVGAPAAMCDAMPITCLAGSDEGLSGAPDTVRHVNETGADVTVFVVVDGTSTTGGAFTLDVVVGAPPPGDTCQSAEPITLSSGMATVSATTATASLYANDYVPTDASCEDGEGNDRVHAVTVPAGERLIATVTPQTGFDVTLNLVGGPAAMCDASPIVCLESADNGSSGGAETVTYVNPTGSPVEVLLVVDGYDSDDEGTYDLAVTVGVIPPPPAGDTCQLAEPITLTGGAATVTGTTATTAGYVDDYQPPSGCAGSFLHDGNDRVHAITVPAGARLTATVTPTTSWDTSIYFVGGPAASCDADPIVCLAGADASGSGAAETIAYDNTTAAPVEVMIVVDSYDPSDEGDYALAVTVQ